MVSIPEIPVDTVDIDKGFHHGVYVSIQFKSGDFVYAPYKQTEKGPDPDEVDTEENFIDEERNTYWRIVVSGRYGEKYLLRSKISWMSKRRGFDFLLRVYILWKYQVLTGRRWFMKLEYEGLIF